jgi:hypothetical protein
VCRRAGATARNMPPTLCRTPQCSHMLHKVHCMLPLPQVLPLPRVVSLPLRNRRTGRIPWKAHSVKHHCPGQRHHTLSFCTPGTGLIKHRRGGTLFWYSTSGTHRRHGTAFRYNTSGTHKRRGTTFRYDTLVLTKGKVIRYSVIATGLHSHSGGTIAKLAKSRKIFHQRLLFESCGACLL